MKLSWFLLFSLMITLPVMGQIDNPTGFTPLPARESTNTNLNTKLSTPESRGMSNNNSFLHTGENRSKPLEVEKEKELNMTTNNGLMTRKFDYKPSWLKKDDEIKSEFSKGQLLGTYDTKSTTVEILCRDHQYVDGDRVRIIVNDQVIIHNINLRADFQSFVVDLNEGRNVIEFEALNQGTSGPNTAHFKVFDDKDNLLTENVWNLLTGVKATLVVIRNN